MAFDALMYLENPGEQARNVVWLPFQMSREGPTGLAKMDTKNKIKDITKGKFGSHNLSGEW